MKSSRNMSHLQNNKMTRLFIVILIFLLNVDVRGSLVKWKTSRPSDIKFKLLLVRALVFIECVLYFDLFLIRSLHFVVGFQICDRFER